MKSICSRSPVRSAPPIRRTAGRRKLSRSACSRCSKRTSTRSTAPATSSRGIRFETMAIDPERLLAHRFPEIRHRYVERDAILYALGIGLGADPLDQDDLAYLIETNLSV